MIAKNKRRITISIPVESQQDVENTALKLGMTKSQYIELAIREKLCRDAESLSRTTQQSPFARPIMKSV